MRFIARDYQQVIIDHIIKHPSALVLAQMGAGKTAATLEALKGCGCKRVLLIAPLRVAKHTWPSEIAKWYNFARYEYEVAVGTPKVRAAAIEAKAPLTIINTENLLWLLNTYKGTEFMDYDMVIIDESSMFKNQSSKRFKELRKWRTKCKVKRWVLLTATPTPNSLLELWPQAFILDAGQRLGTAFTKFRSRYFDSDFMGFKWTPKSHADTAIHDKVKDISVVVERYDGLPEKVMLNEYVQLPPEAMGVYEQLKKDLWLQLGSSSNEITAVNAAVLAGKLLQIAGGAVYDVSGGYNNIHDVKMGALSSLLEQAEGENVIVVYNYKHEYERIIAKHPHAVSVTEKDAIERWNKGEIKLLIAHPASMAHGINAQDGGRRIIWYSPSWSNELNMQFNARLHRQGQTQTVFVHTIIATGTIDEDVIDAVEHKRSVQEILLGAIKNK